MSLYYEHRALTDHVPPQTSKKNMKKLLELKLHAEKLSEVLTPLSGIDKNIKLPSEFENAIKTFEKYAEFQHVKPILVICQYSSELNALVSNLKCRPPQGFLRRMIEADDDRDDLTLLSEGIKNAIAVLTVSCH